MIKVSFSAENLCLNLHNLNTIVIKVKMQLFGELQEEIETHALNEIVFAR